MLKRLPTIVAFLLFAQYAFSQSQATTGNIQGRVIDQNGAAVPGIAISIISADTGFSKSTVSDNNGNYIFVLLPPGRYIVRTGPSGGFAGFPPKNVIVSVGAELSLDIKLEIAGTTSAVDIHASDPGIEPDRTSVSLTIDEKRIRNLPVFSRNFMDFALLTPGIVRDPIRGGNLAVGGQIGTLNSLQVDGVSDDNTYFGKATGNVGTGRAPFQFSMDAVREFQINQSGFSAEFGRAAGAVINVVTKSGTNQFHGSGFWYFHDESLDSNSTAVKANQVLANLPNRRSPLQINDFGGALGGPVKKERIFFFAAYEGQPRTATNVPVIKSLPFAPPAVQSLIAPKLYPTCVCADQNSFFVKTDIYANDKNQAWITYNQQKFTGRNFINAGLLTPEENNGIQKVDTLSLTGSLTSTIKPEWFNEFRLQFSRDRQPAVPNLTTPQVSVSAAAGGFSDGTFSFGGNSTLPREITITRYQFVDNQTFLHGSHTIRFGSDLLFDRIFNLASDFFRGSYTFPVINGNGYTALSNQLSTPGTQFASKFRQSFAGAGTTGRETHPNSTEYGFFLQDDWRFLPKLTISAGLRYDYQSLAKPQIQNPNAALLAAGFDTRFVPSDKNNFSPRIGLSYSFNEKTVLRGGYGIYYGRTPAIMVGLAHSQNGIQVVAFDINCSSTPALCPLYPAVFTSQPSGATPAPINLYVFDKNYKQPFTYQARVELERQVFHDINFSITYEIFRGLDLPRARNANLGVPVSRVLPVYNDLVPTGETLSILRFPNAGVIPEFKSIAVFESTARSLYHGLTFALNNRLYGPVKFFLSYTLSNAKDDRPDPQLQVNIDNPNDITGLYGRSDVDVRHRFIFAPVYEPGKFPSKNRFIRILLSDYVLSGIYTAQSGAPYSAVISGDPNGDGSDLNDRVPGTARNQYSTPPRSILDMRIGRTIRFDERVKMMLFAEAFNALNRSNVSTIINTEYTYSAATERLTLATASFGTTRVFVAPSQLNNASNASSNRAVQLGLRFEF
jgi:hypothetical protein